MLRVIIQHETPKRKINNKYPCWQDNHSLPRAVRWLKLRGFKFFDQKQYSVLVSEQK